MEEAAEDGLSRMRRQLLDVMSGWSEDHYAAGWLIGLEWRLVREGGVWELLGRHLGWPVGGPDGPAHEGKHWITWEEAVARAAESDRSRA